MTDTQTVQKSQLSLETISVAIGIGAPYALAATASYEMGYLDSFGLTYQDVSLSLADLSVNSLLWLPFAICAVLIVLWASSTPTSTATNSKSALSRISRFVNSTPGLTICALIFYAINGSSAFPFLLYAAITIFGDFVIIALMKNPTLENVPSHLRMLLCYAILFLALLFYVGNMMAKSAIGKHPNANISLVGERKSIRASILQSFERGYLISDGTPFYIKRDSVQDIHFDPKTEKVGLPCYWFNVLCPPKSSG